MSKRAKTLGIGLGLILAAMTWGCAGAFVTLARERIEVDGFGREPDRTLELRARDGSVREY